jgi:acid stress-induced BolA-like protein IbaG/YrbA
MKKHETDFEGAVPDAIREAILARIPGADVTVDGGGGHFTIEVAHEVFAGKGMLESQRLVYGAIAHLMKGERPPVHAVDALKTRARASGPPAP